MNRSFKIILAALLLLAPNVSRADDVECPEDKVKTCFMDGHNPSCVCLLPASSTEEVAPSGPNEGEESLEYVGDGPPPGDNGGGEEEGGEEG